MPRFFVLIILAFLHLQACRSGHFEDRSTMLKDSAESSTAFEVAVYQSNAHPIASADRSHATHIETTLSLKTRDRQAQPIRNQTIEINFDHPAVISSRSLKMKTNDEGRVTVALDVGPNEEGPLSETYDIKIQVKTESFGEAFGILQLDLRRENALGQWQESSKAQFDQTLPFEFKVEADRQVFLKSYKDISSSQRQYLAELRFKILRSEKSPLSNYAIHAIVKSESTNREFETSTDMNGELVLTFEIPAAVYGPYEPFIGLFTFEIERHQNKIAKSKSVLIPMGEVISSQTLPVVAKDTISELDGAKGESTAAQLLVHMNDIRRDREQMSVNSSLGLQLDQSLELQMSLEVRRPNAVGYSIAKVLRSVPVSGQWILLHSKNENLENAVIASHQRFTQSTDENGVLNIKTSVTYTDLKNRNAPAYFIFALELPEIRGLPTTFIKISEANLSKVDLISRTEADQILGGALVRGPILAPIEPKRSALNLKYLDEIQSLQALFNQKGTDNRANNRERDAALGQIKEWLNRLPSPTDTETVKALYLALATIAGVATGDVKYSFRWDELLFVDELTKQNVKSATLTEDLNDQLSRFGISHSRAYIAELSGRAQSCTQFSLWKPQANSNPPTGEWVRLYNCSNEYKNFGPLTENYLLLSTDDNILIRGARNLNEARAKILNLRSEPNRSDPSEFFKSIDQYSSPNLEGVIVRPIYPVTK